VCFRVPVWGFAGGGAEKTPAGDYSINTTSTTSDFTQSAPSSPAQTRCASRFDDPDALKSQFVPRAKTPTGEAPSKPTVSTAVSMPPPPKEMKGRQFLSDSSGPSGHELPPPAVLLSSKVVPPHATSVAATSVASSSGTSASSDAPPPKKKPVKGAGKKATVRSADQEATHPMVDHDPMVTRASRAGSLRGVGGSGKKDTCGANGTPSKT
jgi:hypothetical protein